MKKTIILTILGIVSISIGVSQNLEQNLKKYWYYRDRLKTHFMVVDNNNAQGTNIPAGRRYDEEEGGVMKTVLKWGDASAYLGMYISVLATEYRLLKDNQQDYSETLQELKNALQAFERLDKYAEYWWHDPHSIDLPNDINGFFIRDDVGSDPLSSYNYILNHPNSLLTQSGITTIKSDFINGDDGGHPCEMSKDQVWLILPSLALVESLVDEPNYIIQDVLGANVTFREWVRKITHRVISYCQGQPYEISFPPIIITYPCDWYIYNPVTSQAVRRGPDVIEDGLFYTWYFNFGFAEAGNSITDLQNYSSLHCNLSDTRGTDFREDARFQASYNPVSFYSFGSLISIMNGESSWQGLGWGGDSFTYYEFLRHVMLDVHWYEHLRLIRGIIHSFSDISYSQQNARQTYLDLLNSAPECGPYNFNEIVNGYWAQLDWSSLNRLIWPEWLGDSNDKMGHYSGLDYMLLHNLFCLTYENFIENVEIGDVSPIVQSTDIVSSNTILANASVFYIADRKITLKPGFHAENSSFFKADINTSNNILDYRKVNFQPQCSFDQPASMKAGFVVELLTDSIVLDSLKDFEKENCLKTEILIFPNPSSGRFEIQCNSSEELINAIEIVNALGQSVFSSFEISERIVNIDISNQTNGIYFMKVVVGSIIHNKQVIVQ
ncbi:MAG: T9SS type A sorting domain-containing protein [Bacteroidetes bacterium]|jgi:hypothetical protein|nr:T9SS type A sorting domain-containing protein [Bacteroidota bacterium]MBT6836144.1 T9SS type A sorting domain-containing protein [Bacteroidota bacterium]